MNSGSGYSVQPSEKGREVSRLIPVSHNRNGGRNRTGGKKGRKRSRKRRPDPDEVGIVEQTDQDLKKQSPDEGPDEGNHVVDCLV